MSNLGTDLLNSIQTHDSTAKSALQTSFASSTDSKDPFEDVLIWPRVAPTDPSQRKRRIPEHVPSVATSNRWLQWYQKKDLEKKEIEDAKKAKIEQRKALKEKRDKEKLLKAAQRKEKQEQKQANAKKKVVRARKTKNMK